MRLIETSLDITLRAYAGKVDKAGRPMRVMAKMRADLEMSAALLHDVLRRSELCCLKLWKISKRDWLPMLLRSWPTFPISRTSSR